MTRLNLRPPRINVPVKGSFWKAWLAYMAATMRYHNQSNMAAIGIEEQEVMEYTDNRMLGAGNPNRVPAFSDFYKGPISPDSLTSLSRLDNRLEALKAGRQ